MKEKLQISDLFEDIDNFISKNPESIYGISDYLSVLKHLRDLALGIKKDEKNTRSFNRKIYTNLTNNPCYKKGFIKTHQISSELIHRLMNVSESKGIIAAYNTTIVIISELLLWPKGYVTDTSLDKLIKVIYQPEDQLDDGYNL